MTAEAPGVLGPPADLRPLLAISPSQYSGLRECSLRGVWAADRAPRPLPESPAARLGTLAHRLLEEAGRGQLSGLTSNAIADRWDELVASANEKMAGHWLDRHLVPLSVSVPDFEVRKLRALLRAGMLASAAVRDEADPHDSRQSLGLELAVSTSDGRAAGRIDAVVPSPHGPILRDYKSGVIYDVAASGHLALKESYATQLKLYAAVYSEMTGEWPYRLEVVPLVGESEEIPFSREECLDLLNESSALLDGINALVLADAPLGTRMDRLASPSPDACRFCAYRPWCRPYQRAATVVPENWPPDAWGQVHEVRTLGNGRALVTLERDGQFISVRGLDQRAERHPALSKIAEGIEVAMFGLRRSGGPSSFAEGPSTVIYRLTDQTASIVEGDLPRRA